MLDGASDNGLLAPHIRDEIAADVQRAEQGERLVHVLLDATDARAGQASSPDERRQVLDDFGKAEKLVSDVVQAAEHARGRNGDLTKIVWAAGQARRDAESMPTLKKSMAERRPLPGNRSIRPTRAPGSCRTHRGNEARRGGYCPAGSTAPACCWASTRRRSTRCSPDWRP